MEGSFLSSLIDTTGNDFVFGKTESGYRSIFLDFGTNNSQETYKTNYVQLYHGHELKPIHTQPLLRRNISPDWFFPLIIIILIVFTWLRLFYSKFFSQMVQAFLNSNLANQIVRDENIFVQRASVYLSILFNLVAALFLYLLSIRFNWSLGGIGNGFSRYVFFVITVSSAYAIKFLILKICGWLFEQEREMATYIFNIFLINNILGMALLPIICLIAYNEALTFSWVLTLPIILIAIAFLWRIFRGLQIGLSITSFSPLYLFLYLCTLEIAPLVVLIRIIV
jgi:hypothetical protein